MRKMWTNELNSTERWRKMNIGPPYFLNHCSPILLNTEGNHWLNLEIRCSPTDVTPFVSDETVVVSGQRCTSKVVWLEPTLKLTKKPIAECPYRDMLWVILLFILSASFRDARAPPAAKSTLNALQSEESPSPTSPRRPRRVPDLRDTGAAGWTFQHALLQTHSSERCPSYCTFFLFVLSLRLPEITLQINFLYLFQVQPLSSREPKGTLTSSWRGI